MKNLKDIILEKLKVSANTESLSFTFSDLCDSIVQFVNKHSSKEDVYKFGTEHEVKIYKLDYFKDNPLIIKDDTHIDALITFQGCKIGDMLFNTKHPDYITCHTTGRSITLKDKFSVDQSFNITEKTFSKIFNIGDLEKLYSILNEEL